MKFTAKKSYATCVRCQQRLCNLTCGPAEVNQTRNRSEGQTNLLAILLWVKLLPSRTFTTVQGLVYGGVVKGTGIAGVVPIIEARVVWVDAGVDYTCAQKQIHAGRTQLLLLL